METEAHVYTKETFYHWVPELNTVAQLLTDSVGGPPAPAWEEDCRTDALQGEVGSQAKENRCPAHRTYRHCSSQLPTHFESVPLRSEDRP